MGNELYVSLDAMLPSQLGERNILTKIMQEEYKSKTFADMLQYLMQPEPDALNREQYTEGQMAVVNHVKGLLDKESLKPGTIRLSAHTVEGYPEPLIKVDLDRIVSDYNDKILKLKRVTEPSGTSVDYEAIELAITTSTPGGY